MSVIVHNVVLVVIYGVCFLTPSESCNLHILDRVLVLLVNVRVTLAIPLLLVVTLVVELLVLLIIVIRVLRVSLQVLVGNLRMHHEVLRVLRAMHYGGNVPVVLVPGLNLW